MYFAITCVSKKKVKLYAYRNIKLEIYGGIFNDLHITKTCQHFRYSLTFINYKKKLDYKCNLFTA